MIELNIKMQTSESKKEEIIDTLKSLAAPIRVQEGCMYYEISEDLFQPNLLVLNQKWDNNINLKSHLKTNQFRSFLVVLDQLQEPPEFSVSFVSLHTELPDVNEMITFLGAELDLKGSSQ